MPWEISLLVSCFIGDCRSSMPSIKSTHNKILLIDGAVVLTGSFNFTPMDSGAVESLGKQFQRRLRGCLQFWTRPGLSHLLRLCVLLKSKDDHLLWN